ncbi:MAG: hydroxymethylglutaryl-CoA lyase [Actinobacteria bacterium ATB1]|nr:hydroxymethylglutaryl-CoA lyase [Actinobacteria bacterium ATB1]
MRDEGRTGLGPGILRFPSTISIREVGPRDGLQNEDPLPIEDRVRLIDALSGTGLRRIEVGAFVHPDAIPAMSGSEEVLARIRRMPDVSYSALVPNVRGMERALVAEVDEVEVVVSASDTHNRKNVRRSTDESLSGIVEILELAGAAGIPVEGVVATAFGCPYEGDVDPSRVAHIASFLLAAGCSGVAFGDTTGMATPTRIQAVLDAFDVESPGELPRERVTMHLHNTRGTGLANLLWSVLQGVTRFDSSVGGLGGCPYAPGATGNIVTEDAVHMLQDMGIDCGVDLDRLLACARLAETLVGRTLPSQVLRAGPRLPPGQPPGWIQTSQR